MAEPIVRRLEPQDVAVWRDIRLAALTLNPHAFGETSAGFQSKNDATGRVVQLELGVGADNSAAIGLYEQHGFQITGKIPRALCHGGVYLDEYMMVCRLGA